LGNDHQELPSEPLCRPDADAAGLGQPPQVAISPASGCSHPALEVVRAPEVPGLRHRRVDPGTRDHPLAFPRSMLQYELAEPGDLAGREPQAVAAGKVAVGLDGPVIRGDPERIEQALTGFVACGPSA